MGGERGKDREKSRVEREGMGGGRGRLERGRMGRRRRVERRGRVERREGRKGGEGWR